MTLVLKSYAISAVHLHELSSTPCASIGGLGRKRLGLAHLGVRAAGIVSRVSRRVPQAVQNRPIMVPKCAATKISLRPPDLLKATTPTMDAAPVHTAPRSCCEGAERRKSRATVQVRRIRIRHPRTGAPSMVRARQRTTLAGARWLLRRGREADGQSPEEVERRCMF